jgi:hypothetical protein
MGEGHEPDGDNQYRIGSLTKTFGAVLVMRLRDEGRLDLADPLARHLDAPEVPDVSIAQLRDARTVVGADAWRAASRAGRRARPPAPPGRAAVPLLALTGLWYWGPRPYVLRLGAERSVELQPAAGRGRASRFRAEPDGTWTGLDGYYTGEALRVVPGPDGQAGHLDLGSFVFTRQPYGPDAPPGARPDPDGWRAG